MPLWSGMEMRATTGVSEGELLCFYLQDAQKRCSTCSHPFSSTHSPQGGSKHSVPSQGKQQHTPPLHRGN